MKTFVKKYHSFSSFYIDSLDWWLKQEEVSPTLILSHKSIKVEFLETKGYNYL